MAETHDDFRAVSVTRSRADFEVRGQRLSLDDKRVIARGGERMRHAFEDSAAVVLDAAGLAVHEILRAHYLATEGSPDSLVTETDTEDRRGRQDVLRHLTDKFHANTGFLRRARPRRDQDAFRTHGLYVLDRDLVIAAHFDLRPQLCQILHQVV